jgi:hypothetical protein
VESFNQGQFALLVPDLNAQTENETLFMLFTTVMALEAFWNELEEMALVGARLRLAGCRQRFFWCIVRAFHETDDLSRRHILCLSLFTDIPR